MARIFEYDGKRYPDPDPSKPVDEVRQVLANFFPELSNAATGNRKEGEDEIFTFTKRVGTKGAEKLVHLRDKRLNIPIHFLMRKRGRLLTDDPSKVTCGTCLRMIARAKKYKERNA